MDAIGRSASFCVFSRIRARPEVTGGLRPAAEGSVGVRPPARQAVRWSHRGVPDRSRFAADSPSTRTPPRIGPCGPGEGVVAALVYAGELSDRVADVADHGRKCAAEDDQGEDRDDGDKNEDECIFDETLTMFRRPPTMPSWDGSHTDRAHTLDAPPFRPRTSQREAWGAERPPGVSITRPSEPRLTGEAIVPVTSGRVKETTGLLGAPIPRT